MTNQDFQQFSSELEERFLRYVQIDTQSDEASTSTPSTERQWDLLRLLADELTAMGASDVTLTDYACCLATIPSTVPDKQVPTIAFMAHVDTTAQFNGFGVKPIVHHNYNGEPIVLPDDATQVLSSDELPYLAAKVGDDIINASGTTLLAADDKAGVTIIMTMAKHLLDHPDIPHGAVRVCFTPDEEIGRGVHERLPQDLGADVAYTLDGAEAGEVVYETFSADKGVVTVQGVSIHPGDAKGVMVNALTVASDIIQKLPRETLTPETTEGREGFIHLYQQVGGSHETTLQFIIRDFERDKLATHGELLQSICAEVQASEPRATITCEITPQYRNMRYWLENDMRPVNLATKAVEQLGLTVINTPIRGGTDGSRLTEMGVPTPNLFTGMQNIHGPLEWVSVQDMAKATRMLVNLAQLWSE
ncbi:MAG: peptidase T [Chloroflexota bacterium]